MTHELSIPIAFLAGIVSFLSPCVLPLVPGYISMLSGASIEELKKEASGELLRRVLRNSLAFVVGFSVVFVILGASATWVGQFLRAQPSHLQHYRRHHCDYFRIALDRLGEDPAALS